jgi:hypothetical protein
MNTYFRCGSWACAGSIATLVAITVTTGFGGRAAAAGRIAAQGVPGREVAGAEQSTSVVDHGAGVTSIPSAAISAPLVDPATGATVRIVSAQIVWTRDDGALLGCDLEQHSVDAAGSDPLLWTRTGVDPSVYDGAAAPTAEQSYEIALSPVAGRTWFEVEKPSQIAVDVLRVH